MKYKSILITLIFSLTLSILNHDLILGFPTILTGILCAYFTSERKKINYLFGLINYLLMGYIAFKNNLYGIFFSYLILFAPLQIYGFFTWKKNMDKDNKVKIKKLSPTNSLLVITICILCSILLAYLLNKIPHQKLAFLDASSNIINLCGIFFMVFGYKEGWWLWLINNIIDFLLWTILFINKGPNTTIMLATSTCYLILNIIGIIKWSHQKEPSNYLE